MTQVLPGSAPSLVTPEAQDIIIVGASGDLTRRKLLPALYNLFVGGLLPDEGRIIGFARTEMSSQDFVDLAHESVKQFSRTGLDEEVWTRFAQRLAYVQIQDGAFDRLAKETQTKNRVIYVATPPAAVPAMVAYLAQSNLEQGSRLILEKPFGEDLQSARDLNHTVRRYFEERQIFRIDHYLGKETVQNILVFRFGNAVFERVWNRDAIQRIEITVAESLGMEGRGKFYDEVGALRDILQNHVLQMLSLLTMEAPSSLDDEDIRDEKAKLLEAVRPVKPEDTVRVQYTEGIVNGERVPAYRQEPDVPADSDTETYIACRVYIDTWRWAGVPIYLRTGKRLPMRATQIDIEFKPVPLQLFHETPSETHPNHLTLRIQPEESIKFRFAAKRPGPEFDLKQVDMDFSYDEAFIVEPAEAYERLIHDVLCGDQTLFVREDQVEASWQIVEPILLNPPAITFHPAGTWPDAAPLPAPDSWHLK
jgi:glucose-6-phosphate 1-dehydrogenase